MKNAFTQISNSFLDNYLSLLKGSEVKVFLFICRQTIGWNKEQDRISTSQFTAKTGLSNRAVIDAIRVLEEHKLIAVSIKNGNKYYRLTYEKSSQVKDKPMKKVHSTYEKSSQVAYEESSYTKETITKDTIQKKDSLAFGIAEYLYESIKAYDPTHKYNRTKPALASWEKEIERAMRIDGRTKEQLVFIIDYIFKQQGQNSTFWASNIESGKKLRAKFDTIKNQIKNEHARKQRKQKQTYDHLITDENLKQWVG